MARISEILKGSEQDYINSQTAYAAHLTNKNNPHETTKGQVGLSNVDNVKQATKAEFDTHTGNKSNPHVVTKAQIGLGNVNNTSDLNKPISTATQAALNNKVDKVSGKGLSTYDFSGAYKTKLDNLADEIGKAEHPAQIINGNWWIYRNGAYIDSGVKAGKGDAGDSGVYVGTTEPEDENVRVWIDSSTPLDESEVERILGILKLTDEEVVVDLTGYVQDGELNAALEDYIQTATLNKIQGMIDNGEVTLYSKRMVLRETTAGTHTTAEYPVFKGFIDNDTWVIANSGNTASAVKIRGGALITGFGGVDKVFPGLLDATAIAGVMCYGVTCTVAGETKFEIRAWYTDNTAITIHTLNTIDASTVICESAGDAMYAGLCTRSGADYTYRYYKFEPIVLEFLTQTELWIKTSIYPTVYATQMTSEVYIGRLDGSLRGYNRATGSALWTVTDGYYTIDITDTGDGVLLCSQIKLSDKTLYLIERDATTGDIILAADIGIVFANALTAADKPDVYIKTFGEQYWMIDYESNKAFYRSLIGLSEKYIPSVATQQLEYTLTGYTLFRYGNSQVLVTTTDGLKAFEICEKYYLE